jgi:hypothetical protein
MAVYASLIVLVCALGLTLLLHEYLDQYLKSRITNVLERSYPGFSIQIVRMHYRILANRLECDSVVLRKNGSTISCSIDRLSLSGIDRMRFVRGEGDIPGELARSHADAQNVVLTFLQAQYELRCARLRISVPDSTLTMDASEVHPPVDDEQFFVGSKFRRTRYRLLIPQCSVTGLDCLGLLEGKCYRARTAEIHDASLSVLINKDKPVDGNAPSPRMPGVILSMIKEPAHLDSMRIRDGRLMYDERYGPGLAPAELTCESLQVEGEGIGNTSDHGDTAILRAQGILMSGGTVSVRWAMPVASSAFSFRYSGVLSGMNLGNFNSFLEIAEHKRLKAGTLHEAAFDIEVTTGRASGHVHLSYENLKIVAIEDRTGSEDGVGNRLVSFIANNIKLRTTNMADQSGSMKIGQVSYTRKNDETFFEFAWFALRGGIADVVGF